MIKLNSIASYCCNFRPTNTKRDSKSCDVVLDVSDTDADNLKNSAPPKKKHKKEHKHKHKKHGLDKNDKYKKHKKHKKHKHKSNSVTEQETVVLDVTNDRYTPELSPTMEANKIEVKCADNGKVGANGESKECVELESDANDVVKYVTSGLVETGSLEVISSESEDGTPEVECDSDAIDVDVIEADMDLEELMKQKELLQAEIAKALNAELNTGSSPLETNKNGKKEKVDEIILLDDSSNEAEIYAKPDKYSQNRERRIVFEHSGNSNRNESRRNRSNSRERNHKEMEKYKSDRSYSKEIRSRDHKSVERFRNSKDVDYKSRDFRRSRSRDRRAGGRDKDFNRDKSYERDHSRGRELQMDKRRTQASSRVRYSSRDRSNRYNDRVDRDRHRGRERSRERDKSKDRRNRDRYKGRNEKYDKYQGSLSEGLKQVMSGSDSDIELDIDINDEEEDEQEIIERRRKQREELLKVGKRFFVL